MLQTVYEKIAWRGNWKIRQRGCTENRDEIIFFIFFQKKSDLKSLLPIGFALMYRMTIKISSYCYFAPMWEMRTH